MRRPLAIAFATLGIGLISLSCKTAPGDECKPNTPSKCTNKSTALICRGGHLITATCGSDSCKQAGSEVVCDQSHGELGQVCIADMEYACSNDGVTGMQCIGGSFKPNVVCRGPKGCRVQSKRIACDTSVAILGDPCALEDALSCAADKKTLLRCKLKSVELYRDCRGPKGCVADETLPQCDNTLANLDDPCPAAGRVACSVDKSKELLCQGGRFTLSRECKNGCSVSVVGGSVTCK